MDTYRKNIWQNPTSIHDKKSQQTRNRGELPQLDKEHLQKHLQLILYLMVRSSKLLSSLETRQECPLLPLFFIILEVLDNAIRQEKEIKVHRLGRKKQNHRASLVAQWLRIHLPMQGTGVRALVWEDPTCRGATRPVSHNYWAWASGACAPQQERPW